MINYNHTKTRTNISHASTPIWKMINSFLQIVPVVAARCCSISPHALSSHSLFLTPCAALRESPDYRLPRNLCNSDPDGSAWEWLATAFDTSPVSDHRLHKPRPAGFADTKQSKSIVCWSFSRQMTIVHRVLIGLARLAQPGFRTNHPGSAIFFNPGADGVASHTKSASQAAQTAAFLVSPQDGVFFLLAIAEGLGILSTALATIVAKETLLAITSFAIANDIVALAVITKLFNHRREFTSSRPFEPLPKSERFCLTLYTSTGFIMSSCIAGI